MNLLLNIKDWKLRTKFILPISGMLIAFTIVISAYLVQHQTENFRHELETSGITMIRILAMQAESGVLFEDEYDLNELLERFSVFQDVQSATIFNSDGRTLSSLGEWNPQEIRVLREITHEAFNSHTSCRNFYIEDRFGKELIELNYPVTTRNENLDRENLGITSGINQTLPREYATEEIGSVKLILSMANVNEYIAEARTAIIATTLIVVAFIVVILAFFVQLITKPVKMLVQVTNQVSQGDLEQRVDINQKDEIGQLANTFNSMIESLRHSRDEIEEYNHTLEERIIQRTLELEEAQSQLIQSEKMSAIGQLAAGVAHELNNPLGGILGYSQFALEKMKKSKLAETGDKETANYIRYLTDIESQTRRCKSIVQNLLRFSRSSRTIEFNDISINSVIKETITFIEHQLHMKQIELEVDLNPDLPIIQGNAGQLQQVFTNLIINAMHASEPETKITIVSQFSPALGEFSGTVEISVIDQGCGISPENINKIFEPFFTTKDVGQGTGLGLSVSYGIIKEHGGEIKIDSTVGVGTRFNIILPVQKSKTNSDTQVKKLTIS